MPQSQVQVGNIPVELELMRNASTLGMVAKVVPNDHKILIVLVTPVVVNWMLFLGSEVSTWCQICFYIGWSFNIHIIRRLPACLCTR